MNRERLAWMFCTLAVVVLSVRLSGSGLLATAPRDDDYAFVRTLVDIQRQIAGNYVDEVDSTRLRQAAIDGMLEELDPFTIYVPPARQEEFDRFLEGSFKGIGVQLNQVGNGDIEVVSPVDGSPAFKAGVMAGDVILKVNGESVEGTPLRQATKKLAGPVGTDVSLTVRRVTGEVLDLRMTRDEIIVPTVRGFSRQANNAWDWFVNPEEKIAYLRVTQFTSETFEAVKSAIDEMLAQGMQGLILDLRFNPGGRLDQAIKVVDLFVESGVIVSTRGKYRKEQSAVAVTDGTLPRFPLIVLVNEHSASASEIVAGSLKDHRRALVIGQRTYGKGSVQEVVPLEQDGGELKMTVAHYYLPSGRLVHRKKDATDWGVDPNIEVKLDEKQQLDLQRQRFEAELFRKPSRPTTSPATAPSAASEASDTGEEPGPDAPEVAATQPETSPSPLAFDPQLQRAVDTVTALLVLGGDATQALNDPVTPTTRPATGPATRPGE